MGQSGSFGQWGGQARRAARCGISGKRRNAADEPLWPPSSNLAKAGFYCPVAASRFSSDDPHRMSKRSLPRDKIIPVK